MANFKTWCRLPSMHGVVGDTCHFKFVIFVGAFATKYSSHKARDTL